MVSWWIKDESLLEEYDGFVIDLLNNVSFVVEALDKLPE
jgi:hypothetical protein